MRVVIVRGSIAAGGGVGNGGFGWGGVRHRWQTPGRWGLGYGVQKGRARLAKSLLGTSLNP